MFFFFSSFLPPGAGNQGMGSGPIRRRITDKNPISLPSGSLSDFCMNTTFRQSFAYLMFFNANIFISIH